ncbi:MAG: DUF262 domain-containing protein [Gallionella sp.]|jgi:hypothetical protein
MTVEKREEPELYEELTSDQRGTTGVEVELTDVEASSIKEPFDPEKIDVKTKPMNVDLIMARVRGGNDEIDLMPDFQRRAGIWDETRKSRLIESLLLRIPLPVFYVASSRDERWSVVDGLQRITTLKEFIVDESLVLNDLEFLRDLNGKTFDKLSREMQRRIQETEITVHIIQPGTPSAVMFNIFKRINTGGLPLSPQEIRHAIKQGKTTLLLKQLAESEEFKKATGGSIKDERMADRECVLRFCAFSIHEPQAYMSGDLDSLLIQTMDEINQWSQAQIDELSQQFFTAMNSARRIMGRWAFRKYYGANYRLSPINKALFEVWAVHLSRLTPSQIALLEQQKNALMQNFAALMIRDYEFVGSISTSTGSASNVKRRFREVNKLINAVLYGAPHDN